MASGTSLVPRAQETGCEHVQITSHQTSQRIRRISATKFMSMNTKKKTELHESFSIGYSTLDSTVSNPHIVTMDKASWSPTRTRLPGRQHRSPCRILLSRDESSHCPIRQLRPRNQAQDGSLVPAAGALGSGISGSSGPTASERSESMASKRKLPEGRYEYPSRPISFEVFSVLTF